MRTGAASGMEDPMSESGAVTQWQGGLVDVPLSPVSARFPLGLGTFAAPISNEPVSRRGVRPFGLRFATVAGRTPPSIPPWRLCPDRQIAVVDDRTAEPYYRRLNAGGKGTKPTTGPSPDGGGSTGNEEWRPDYMGDAST